MEDASDRERNENAHRACNQRRDSRMVDRRPFAGRTGVAGIGSCEPRQHHQPDGDVEEERPAPVRPVDDESPGQRSRDGRQAEHAPATPWYLPRSSGGARSPAAEMALTIVTPPPMPCSARKTMSWFIVSLNPMGIEARVKTATPARNMIRRP